MYGSVGQGHFSSNSKRLNQIAHRARYGRSLFPSLLALHKEQAFTWKADILLPSWLDHSAFIKAITKLGRLYPREDHPAIVMLEQAYQCGRYNLHFVGRGLQPSEDQLKMLLIDCLCKDKRREEERHRASRETSVNVETIQDEPGRNIYTAINYLLKTSRHLAKKVIPLPGKNYRDLGLIGAGGIRARKAAYSKSRTKPQGFQPLEFDPDLPDF